MDNLTAVLCEEVLKYAAGGRGANILLFPVVDDARQTYSVLAVDYPSRKATAGVVVLARIVGDQVVIEEDTTDKPLIDALLQRGIRHENIILAYENEPIPDAEQYALP